MFEMLRRIWFLFHFVWYVQAEYKCVCSFDGARPVFIKADKNSDVIGFLATNGCRQFVYPVDENWNAIVFMHQLGFLMSNTSMIHTCFSDPVDSFTTDGTNHATSMTLSTPTFTSTTTQSTTRTTNISFNTPSHSSSTATKATTIATQHPTTTISTTETSVPEDHIELCPDHVKGDLSIFGGYLGQFGDYCFELVNVSTQWYNGQRHCTDAGGGYLAHVSNKAEQDFVVRFLEKHHYVESVWLGLTDSETEGKTTEGHWSWISGVPVTYTNFGHDYNGNGVITHERNDCVIMKQGGEWTDVHCGVSFFFGTGFGESHPFICQFNVTSKPPNIFHIFTDVLVG
ncbi:aggrecan core protein-like isoform X2 [Dreissena polymorpha]|uniref:C-type lectin domain-containing protein n=1 Tax=Dreissena polymorpha TaxID=45954 RepID=A0A9D4IP67_DREPO|nr:aggrecan core protein-like isoform X2 [Dreissena polymorpha]KAH3779992.1 hypothetical protein DPMN_157801 [Dreissena polymorpha]